MSSNRSHKICLSILLEGREIPRLHPSVREVVDILEFRLDKVPDFPISKIQENFSDKQIVLTLRSREEGGFWKRNLEQLIRIYRKAIDSKINYIDVEFTIAKKILPRLPNREKTGIILSYHTKKNLRKELIEILSEMLTIPADVYKLIFTARSLVDNLTALRLLEHLKSSRKKGIVHAMGADGQLSRILGALKGNVWTYVSLGEGAETAAGQLTVQDAVYNYYLKDRKFPVKILGLIGYPIKQSFGWKIHNEVIHRQVYQSENSEEKDWIYVNFPASDFDSFWQDWKNEIFGLSVTIPHKETVIKYLNVASEEVKKSGVCNTLVKRNRGWYGYNTDMLAIYELLSPFSKKLATAPVLILGTGGTSRSAITALRRLGIEEIIISGRNQNRGKYLASEFNVEYEPIGLLEDKKISGIIQTTPVGMYPNTEQIPCLPEILKSDMIVFDVIYNPPKTRFLKIAEEKECQIISGLEMYFLQAKLQLKLFADLEVDIREIREVWASKVKSNTV